MTDLASDPAPATAGLYLRARTRAEHEAVDSAFGAFGIATRAGYARFLQAHARILPLAERLLSPGSLLEGWEGRTAALASDLEILGVSPRPDVDLAPPAGEAARWGGIYVIEGSRLGGLMLSRSVPADLPAAYLCAAHPSGGWRRILETLDAADVGPAWRAEAALGAKALFGAYLAAASD